MNSDHAQTTLNANTLTPLEPPFSPEIAAIFTRYPQDKDGYILKLFRVFARSQRFLTNKGVTNLLDKDSPLSMRLREIVILRTTANNACEYEWGVHVSAFAKAAKLTPEQVQATCDKEINANLWNESECTLLRCVDDWCQQARLTSDNLTAFQTHFNVAEQLEVIALVGNYHTVSFVANTAQLDLEPNSAKFPASTSTAKTP